MLSRKHASVVYAIVLIIPMCAHVDFLFEDENSVEPYVLREAESDKVVPTPPTEDSPIAPEEHPVDATPSLTDHEAMVVPSPEEPSSPPVEACIEVPDPPEEEEPCGIEVPDPPSEEEPDEIEVPGPPPRVDVNFCLDTTGSMRDEIFVAKQTILDIAAAVVAGTPTPEVRYSLVIYRDLGDDYVTQVHDFMDAETLSTVLWDVRAAGGGDYEESVSEALHRSVHEVSWDLGVADCAIYLIGDAPPHKDYDNGFDHIQAANDAKERAIVINAIGCSGIEYNPEDFEEVAKITGGSFVLLNYTDDSSSGYYYEATPGCCYDGKGYGSGGGSGSGDSSGSGDDTGGDDGSGTEEGGGQGQSNDLDSVLIQLIQGQGNNQGVNYDDDEESEDG